MSSASGRTRPEADPPSDFFTFENGALSPCSRDLLPEEPLGIVLDGEPLITLMRTPGHEEDLALGFLLTEGLIRSAAEVGAISFCREGVAGARNEVRVHLASGVKPARPLPAHRKVYSSCSVCGAEMIEEAAAGIAPFRRPAGRIAPGDVFILAEGMKVSQELFKRTGAAHGAALLRNCLTLPCHSRESGNPDVRPAVLDSRFRGNDNPLVREDIGRHNALDKAIGAAARQGIPLSESLLLLSGRLSFEMVAKAARAGISDVAAVSAPSALAVTLGRTLNMFLAGFVRNRTMTVYSGADALQTGNARLPGSD
jgi:FdhD protein